MQLLKVIRCLECFLKVSGISQDDSSGILKVKSLIELQGVKN